MSYQITVQPAVEPITLAEAREQLRNDGETFDDAYINTLITTARKFCEDYCNRGFITQTWRENLSFFTEPVCLSMNPVASVISIKYYDTVEVQQTLAGANYQVDILSDNAKIYEGVTLGFPNVSQNTINPIEIIYVVGYGLAVDVPLDIKHAIKMMVSFLYENREGVNVPLFSMGTSTPLPEAVKHLLSSYRLRHFG